VTGITLRRGRDMTHALRLCINRYVCTTVTGGTVTYCQRTGCASVAHRGRLEVSGVLVAGVALCRGRNVRGTLGQARTTCHMTRRAGARRSGRVDVSGRYPTRRLMARVTALRGRHMRAALAFGCRTVVARGTGSGHYTTMTESCRYPAGGFVTGIATLCGR
jgi:hypothetical protein